ncbi:hypothetical protein AX774_g570 [Zancudomyces culisetae]|uniref:Uncharacterized protein n=1 Tax=Zancudomyces culisetae TaxID=1213189 RepID=A0A1R1PY43_ZANCU|nr:hypothetical protein AX774_g570 [Zancudomyces culisetae]|eukprot:OMH85873.1 hypothetical protein AX774_g570 [Zancudomyces culisetae]
MAIHQIRTATKIIFDLVKLTLTLPAGCIYFEIDFSFPQAPGSSYLAFYKTSAFHKILDNINDIYKDNEKKSTYYSEWDYLGLEINSPLYSYFLHAYPSLSV